MRRNLLSAIAMLAVVWGVAPVRAQEIQALGSAQEINAQPIQLTSNWNDGNVAAGSMASGCTDNSCCEAVNSCCDDCCNRGGIVAGVELIMFKAHLNSQNGALGGIATMGPTWDWEAAPRIWLGAENGEGLGARLRYMQFNHESSNLGALGIAGGLGVSEGLEIHELDAEVYQVGQVQRLEIQGGAGLRYGSLRRTPAFVGVGQLELQYDGVGPTVFVNGTRPIGNGGLALYAGARGSLLFGDHKISDSAGIGLDGFRIQDQVVSIVEASMGVQWNSQNGNFFARGGLEAQSWHTGQDNSFLPVPLLISLANSSDVGLIGTTFSVGIRR